MARQPDTALPVMSAIEVSPRAAKLLVMTGSPPKVERLAASTMAEGADDPIAAVRALLEAQPLSPRRIGILFGREAFTLRTLELPSTEAHEMASMLELQLGKLTPYSRSEILFGWSSAGSHREGYTAVLLAIARRALVDGILALLRTRGLEPAWVGVSTEGLESWWRRAMPASPGAGGQLAALLDVDYASTDCAIFRDGRLVFSQNITIGASQLSQSDEAALRWIGEMVRLPRILLHEDLQGRVGAAALTGVTKGLDPLVEQLASQWGVAVDIRDPLGAVQLPADAPQRADAARASFTALVGTVLAGRTPTIDLLPPEARLTQALQVRSKRLARCAATLAAVLIFVAVLYAERILLLGQYRNQLDRRFAEVQAASAQVIQEREVMRRINEWLRPSASALELLHAVASAAVPGVTVTHLTYRAAQPPVLRGRAESTSAVFEFLERLKTSAACPGAEASSVAKSRVTGGETAEFEITCAITGV